ncbi:MAG: Chemotaxis protein CheW [Massilia sp.]|jgi:chemotaxis-related protein WspD|nr:Chemotaxis protein CheW [Massilia sp.]
MKMTPTIDDCWNRIGVSGDQSCGKLASHVHCRNCGVYAGAAQRNLQRPVDAAYLAQWAAHLREPVQQREAGGRSALVFRVGREWLALPTRTIGAVAPAATGHRLPHRAAVGLLGIVNVGGKLTPMMSLGALLGIDEQDGPAMAGRHGRHVFARLLVMEWQDRSFALPVADLHGIARFAEASLAPPAATINKGLDRFLTGVLAVGELRVGVLDEAMLGHQLTRALR